jgi:roadblock/LC7 domain-containing protein
MDYNHVDQRAKLDSAARLVYSSQDWTGVIGNGGYRRVFIETGKLDLNRIFEALLN